MFHESPRTRPALRTMHHFIDPASLSPSAESDCPSPSPSASGSNPRKRPRTESSSEERKEARAHRNRIAAQNSRDRRKAQFQYMERRVAELEEENRALRAARGVPLLPVSASTAFKTEEEHKRLEATARDRENEELKERIKTLERGWDAVIKALAAQGLPLANPTTTSSPPPPTSSTTVAPPPIFPLSPAPSHSSLDFSPSSASSPLDTPEPSSSEQQHDTGGDHRRPATDVPAAGGLDLDLNLLFASTSTTTNPHPPTSTLPSGTGPAHSAEPDDATMENLLMEILASPLPAPASPCPAAATACGSAAQEAQERAASAAGRAAEVAVISVVEGEGMGAGAGMEMMDLGLGAGMGMVTGVEGTDLGLGVLGSDWDNGLEMQRILASLGVASEYEAQEQETEQGLSELELEMGWGYGAGVEGLGVGVF
ncbi:hypothetical protein D9615_002632 [Tricholomella constricta]|uniref:X-box-binding protein 1 n=1 Tax=Tricholomella constricta TaxID=117010 RepID=A0A8H5HMT6_9AGAR|nr:hypothetical protein D9615_002632 [Tricholomella constricta]